MKKRFGIIALGCFVFLVSALYVPLYSVPADADTLAYLNTSMRKPVHHTKYCSAFGSPDDCLMDVSKATANNYLRHHPYNTSVNPYLKYSPY